MGTDVRENRLRRMALRQGLRLQKSRRRDPHSIEYGLYALINPTTNGMVNEALAGRFIHSWTLDEVETYLAKD